MNQILIGLQDQHIRIISQQIGELQFHSHGNDDPQLVGAHHDFKGKKDSGTQVTAKSIWQQQLEHRAARAGHQVHNIELHDAVLDTENERNNNYS
jgi:hypothetical protein